MSSECAAPNSSPRQAEMKDLEKGLPSSTDKQKSPVGEQKTAAPTNALEPEPAPLEHILSAASVTGHDIPTTAPARGGIDDNDEIYDRIPSHRKSIITATLAFCGFLAPISSTTVLAAVPEVAATYHCDGSIINLSNAFYMIFMGLSPMFWGPLGQVYGRRWNCIISATLFFAFSMGTALAPNLASFFVFRIFTAFQGTSFLILGSSCIGDIYRPTERATALGWFMSGTLIGPAFGPFVGGIIVTFRTWRDIFWLQSALAGLGALLVFFLLPETIHRKRSVELAGLTRRQRARRMWQWTNPLRVVRLYRYPNLVLVASASSALVWNMYSLLTPIRYVLNPRFGLASPLQSGLFYIAPGCGYLLGTFFGGRWADHIVKKWIEKKGRRVPEDRLRSCLLAVGVVVPACMLVYGWSVEKRVGGVALPVVMMFVQGFAQLICFPCLNTYCLDVMQDRSAEVVAGNYMVRYLFAALGSALCLPAIRKIGVGWFSTVSALFLVGSAVAVHVATIWGEEWRLAMDHRKEVKMAAKASSAAARVAHEADTAEKGAAADAGVMQKSQKD